MHTLNMVIIKKHRCYRRATILYFKKKILEFTLVLKKDVRLHQLWTHKFRGLIFGVFLNYCIYSIATRKLFLLTAGSMFEDALDGSFQ